MSQRKNNKTFVEVPELEDTSQFGYSQCVTYGDKVFVAGQCGLGKDHEIVSEDFEEQARACLERLKAGLEAAGASMDDVMSMTVFVTDVRNGRKFTSLRREYFSEPYPASALIGVSALMPIGAKIEVQATAIRTK